MGAVRSRSGGTGTRFCALIDTGLSSSAKRAVSCCMHIARVMSAVAVASSVPSASLMSEHSAYSWLARSDTSIDSDCIRGCTFCMTMSRRDRTSLASKCFSRFFGTGEGTAAGASSATRVASAATSSATLRVASDSPTCSTSAVVPSPSSASACTSDSSIPSGTSSSAFITSRCESSPSSSPSILHSALQLSSSPVASSLSPLSWCSFAASGDLVTSGSFSALWGLTSAGSAGSIAESDSESDSESEEEGLFLLE
mmetsp:Transcript_17419/g.37905  ORF Transcript_17419/g.37905 Transcript_17419/m.37905 type:complete len:255 (-) Transcript_17419:1886-2650(-)